MTAFGKPQKNTAGKQTFLLKLHCTPTTLVSAAESRRFAAKKIEKNKVTEVKTTKIASHPKYRNLVPHFLGSVKKLDVFNRPFDQPKIHIRGIPLKFFAKLKRWYR